MAAILDFVEKTEKRKKKYQANSRGPICKLQIFENNQSRGFRVRAETKCGGGRQIQQKQYVSTITYWVET